MRKRRSNKTEKRNRTPSIYKLYALKSNHMKQSDIRLAHLIVYFPFVFDGMASKLSHSAFSKGIV